MQAQTSDFRAHKVAQFEDVLRTRDVLMDALARVSKVDGRVVWDVCYSDFPLKVTDVAGASLIPLDLPQLPGLAASGESEPPVTETPAESQRSLVPSFLIPSPALNSCQSPQLQPHHPAGAAADLHVCSSPDPIIIGIEHPKLPRFLMELDTSPVTPAGEPPVVAALRAPAPPQPRTVEAAPAVGLASTGWPGRQMALPAADPSALFAPELTQPATPRIELLAQPIALAAGEPRPAAIPAAADAAASAAWRERALSLPSAAEWLATEGGHSHPPAIPSEAAALPIAAAQERSLDGNPQSSLESAAWPAKPPALPKAVSEEMFPPELVGTEAPAVRAGDSPLALATAAVREGAATPISSLAPAAWKPIDVALPFPAAHLTVSLEHAGPSSALETRVAQPAAVTPASSGPIEAAPALSTPALSLEPVAPEGVAAVPPAATLPTLALTAASVCEGAATPISSLAPAEWKPIDVALPVPAAYLAASLEHAGLSSALETRLAQPAGITPAASGPIEAAPALATPALSLEPVEPEGVAVVPSAATAPIRDAGAQAVAVESAPESDLRQNPWSVPDSVFPFEPSIEFVAERSAPAGASAIAELESNPAPGAPAISAHAQPLAAAAAELRLAPLALEPEPPAYLTAEPPVCEAPLPCSAPAPAAKEGRPVSAAEPARSIAKPKAPLVVPSRPAPHGQEEFQAALANPAAALTAATSSAHPEDILPGASLVARMPLRPQVEAIDPDSTTPAGFILLDYHCHGVQAAPVPSFTWRWRIAPTQLPEFKLRTVPVKLADLIDDKKDVVRPFFQAAKSAVPKPAIHAHPIGLIAAALLLAALVGMGGRAALHSLRGDSHGQTAATTTHSIAPAPMPQIAFHQAPRTASSSKPPGVFARLRQAIADRASLELSDTFQTGMQAWGQAKPLAPGWVKSVEGYVRPGQLALFQPTLSLSNYDMEFLGQIENKSLDWVVRAKDKQNYYAMKFKVVAPGLRPIIAMVHYPVVNGVAGHKTEIPLNVMVHNNSAYRISVSVENNHIITAIEGQEVDRWIDDTLPKGGVGFFADAGERARVYWLRVSRNEDFLGRVCAYLAGDSSPERSVAEIFPLEWNHSYGYNDSVTRYHN